MEPMVVLGIISIVTALIIGLGNRVINVVRLVIEKKSNPSPRHQPVDGLLCIWGEAPTSAGNIPQDRGLCWRTTPGGYPALGLPTFSSGKDS
ncbi:hypothetical protein C8J48_3122 [Desmospora activa DSM 45169]|uniref:Uncharacterized protein n=1 Tax=Desmospora activa DSM 45169 TaxID=1121389 RepID=A0A2T4Z4I0_9BACL|nr:hypothetical protein C8J48_3122 [Desmospora activa DSM 45169]